MDFIARILQVSGSFGLILAAEISSWNLKLIKLIFTHFKNSPTKLANFNYQTNFNLLFFFLHFDCLLAEKKNLSKNSQENN
jgi:hypothetical protein